jgi:hypothetical protein
MPFITPITCKQSATSLPSSPFSISKVTTGSKRH